MGVIYLLHFEEPFHHARHYIGFCNSYEGLDSRFEYHGSGRGSRLLKAVTEKGIKWELVRLWKGTRDDERAFKRLHGATRYCPRCTTTPRNRKGWEELQV